MQDVGFFLLLGALLQCIWLVGKRILNKTFLILVGIIAIIGLFSRPDVLLLIAFLGVVVLFPVIFGREVMPKISEAMLLQMMLIYWYVFVVTQSDLLQALLFPALLLTLIIIGLAVSRWRVPGKARIFLYVSFFIINILLIFLEALELFPQFNQGVENQTLLFIFSGALAVSWSLYTGYLLGLLPTQSLSGKFEWGFWRERIEDIKKSYLDLQLKPIQTALMISIQGGVLVINYFLLIIPHDLAIVLSLLVSSELILKKKGK